MSSRWPDKFVAGGDWHRSWQKTLGHTYSVEAITGFQSGNNRLYYAEMPREQFLAMEKTARAILKILAAKGRQDQYAGSIWLDALLPVGVAQDLHASLRDQFPRWRQEHGHELARFVVNAQIIRVIAGHWLAPLLTALSRIWPR